MTANMATTKPSPYTYPKQEHLSPMLLRSSIFFLLLSLITAIGHTDDKIIIADGDITGKLTTYSLAATTLKIATNINFLKLPVVITGDDQLLVFPSLTLNSSTNVAKLFPDRKRRDDNYYVADFTLREIRQLDLFDTSATTKYDFHTTIPSLQEELGLIRTLELQFKKPVKLAIEIKYPWFYRALNKNISSLLLETIQKYGYGTGSDTLYLQSFDPEELQRIHNILLPAQNIDIPLIQLVGLNDGQETRQLHGATWDPYNYDWLFTHMGLRMVASYATAIALPADLLFDKKGRIRLGNYIKDLHNYGLRLFIYSPQNKQQRLIAKTLPALLDLYFLQAHIDGLYTASFNDVHQYLHNKQQPTTTKRGELPPFFSKLNLARPAAPDRKKITNKK